MLGLELANRVVLQTLGEQWLLQELHLALDRALRWPPVMVENWETGASLSIMEEGSGPQRPNPPEISFYHQSICVPLTFFPFPSGYRTLSK